MSRGPRGSGATVATRSPAPGMAGTVSAPGPRRGCQAWSFLSLWRGESDLLQPLGEELDGGAAGGFPLPVESDSYAIPEVLDPGYDQVSEVLRNQVHPPATRVGHPVPAFDQDAHGSVGLGHLLGDQLLSICRDLAVGEPTLVVLDLHHQAEVT